MLISAATLSVAMMCGVARMLERPLDATAFSTTPNAGMLRPVPRKFVVLASPGRERRQRSPGASSDPRESRRICRPGSRPEQRVLLPPSDVTAVERHAERRGVATPTNP